jgi:twinkle protein
MGKNWAVVSLTRGSKGITNDIKKNFEWLNGWGNIILALDSDEAGRAAAKEAQALLDPSKVKVVEWPAKDANELLVQGKQDIIRDSIMNAKSVRPESIIRASDIIDEILHKPEYGISWPWETLTKATYGIHPKRIYTIGGGSGLGKTEFLINLVGHLIGKEKVQVGAMFLESTPAEIYLRVAGYFMEQRLHVPGCVWNEQEIRDTLDHLDNSLYLYSMALAGEKGSSWEAVKNKIIFMAKGLGIKYIILDHLTALACHMKDERKELDACMAELGALVHTLDITLFLVSHLSKPSEGKSYEEGRMVTANAFRGSQSIQYWSAFMLGLERNKLAENPEERNLTKVRVLKDRFSGEADGLQMYLKYNQGNGRLEELSITGEDEDL